MVPKFRNGNGCRPSRCPVPPVPLLLGFVVGFASAFYLLTSYGADNGVGELPTGRSHRGPADGRRHHRRVDTAAATARTPPAAAPSVLCVVFVGDVDSLLMQRNVWLDKCDDTVYASRRPLEYADGVVVTDTFSPDPWRHLCRTLVRVHRRGLGGSPRRDWIFVARDNLWLIHENLLRLVRLLDDDEGGGGAGRLYYAGRYAADGALAADAGVLLGADTLAALARLLDGADACDAAASDEGRMLDYYLRQLNSTPIANVDSYGCSMFNSINLFEAFDANGLNTNVPKTCLSKSAVTFQLDLFPNYYAMFYKYVLYQIRLVNHQDLMSNDVLPAQQTSDDIWRIEALYELNLDPTNMTQTDFYRFWSKKRQIIL